MLQYSSIAYFFVQLGQKVLQYFVDVGNNSTTSNTFAEVMKVKNHTGQSDAEFAWYSLSATLWICVYGLEHGLGIHVYRPRWLCLIFEVLEIRTKSLEPIGNQVRNIFYLTNVFGCFYILMAHKFPN